MTSRRFITTTGTTAAAAALGCLLAMLALSPVEAGPVGVTLWFVLLLVAVSGALGLAAFAVSRNLRPNAETGDLVPAALRRGLLVGGYVTILLALSSLQQLNLRDAGLLALLLGLIEFYVVAKA